MVLTSLNIASISWGGMVTPSFLMYRKPCREAASSTCWATSLDGLEMSITGIEFWCFSPGDILMKVDVEK